MASSTRCLYFGICEALSRRDGFVVASCGLYLTRASMSPLSATTVVTFFNESSSVIVSVLPFRVGSCPSRSRRASRCSRLCVGGGRRFRCHELGERLLQFRRGERIRH